ncbi:MAG: 4Fe-4S dicluster domain-containing protein [Tannerellaceae bacterium]|nr:4Fe-4S dicluster domain-containing protein [Tannerellaceae bacterium]
MNKLNILNVLRVILAILFFVPILLYFVDFGGKLPDTFHYLAGIQVIPAFLAGMAGIFIFQLLLAFVLGRIYCSVICPAGVLQDIINRIYCIGKKKKKGSRRFKYHKPMNWLRYGLLGIGVLLALAGSIELWTLLDPYSNFGRISANLFRPIVVWGNNLLADVLMKMDNYALYHVTLSTATIAGVIAGFIILIIFAVMVSLRGRLYCNTLCPLGALLGLASKEALFRVSIDKSTCIKCGICEHTCKAEAINSKEMTVDSSRCVDCFNCVSSCSKSSITYGFKPFYKKEEVKEQPAVKPIGKESNSRRSFLATGATVATTLPVVSAIAKSTGVTSSSSGEKVQPITPPGSLNLKQFKEKCTGCHLCVVRCPSQILRPAGLEYGFGYMLKPHVSYMNSYCNYECTVCSEVCPNHALKPLSKEEKAVTQIGIAEFFIDRCIVKTEGTDCGACSEHCPTQAVHMVPYTGTLTIPAVEPDLCVGCGGCESICPVRPDRAIIVKANPVHQYIEKPEEEEVLDIEIDDFGF